MKHYIRTSLSLTAASAAVVTLSACPTKPGLPNADCIDCLVVHDRPTAEIMLSWHDAAEPAPWGMSVSCHSDNRCTPATRKSDVRRRILVVCLRSRSKIWTYWALFADVNTAVWALCKTLVCSILCVSITVCAYMCLIFWYFDIA